MLFEKLIYIKVNSFSQKSPIYISYVSELILVSIKLSNNAFTY